MSRLGIDFISGLAMPPVAFVELAAELGCNAVSMSLTPFTANPHGYPAWSLRDDAGLRANLIAASAANEVTVRTGEVFLIREGSDVSDSASDLSLMADMGFESVNVLSIDRDFARSTDQIGRFASLATDRGLAVTMEFMAGTAVGTLAKSVALINASGATGVKLNIDAMHLARSGGTPADVAALDPALIGYVQLCDVPDKPIDASYGDDALHNRLPLGEGDLPLAELVAAIPANVPVGLELPMLPKALAGIGPHERLAGSVALAKQLLGEA